MSSISKFKRVILGAVAAISLSPAAHAAGDVYDKQVWQETGRGWQVDYVPAVNSCVVGRPHDNNVSLQIFYQPDSDSFTFRILSSKWSAVENGATYDINVRMDGGANRWHAKARGFWTNDGYPGIAIFGVKVDVPQKLHGSQPDRFLQRHQRRVDHRAGARRLGCRHGRAGRLSRLPTGAGTAMAAPSRSRRQAPAA